MKWKTLNKYVQIEPVDLGKEKAEASGFLLPEEEKKSVKEWMPYRVVRSHFIDNQYGWILSRTLIYALEHMVQRIEPEDENKTYCFIQSNYIMCVEDDSLDEEATSDCNGCGYLIEDCECNNSFIED